NFVAALVPCAVREPVGDVLGEDAHRVFTVGDDGGVMNALEVEFAPEVVREFAAAGCGVAGFPFVFGKRGVDLAVVMRLVGSRTRVEVGEFTKVDVELDGAAFDGNLSDAC